LEEIIFLLFYSNLLELEEIILYYFFPIFWNWRKLFSIILLQSSGIGGNYLSIILLKSSGIGGNYLSIIFFQSSGIGGNYSLLFYSNLLKFQ